jgi:hypothetical protein
MRDLSILRRGAGLILMTAVLAGCSSVTNLLDTSSPSSSSGQPAPSGTGGAPADAGAPPHKDSITNMILGTPASGPTPADQVYRPDDLPCPEVTVRAGAGTLLLGSKSSVGEVNAMDLRYQGTLVKFARECKTVAGVMTMKVGIEGRVITGPAGGPGTVDVPLRLAVVQEGPAPKTVLSKLAHIPVTVTAENQTVDFTHIDPEVAFPLPRPLGALDQYVVYVGFDPTATAQKKPPARRKR